MPVVNGLQVGGTYKFSDILNDKKTKKKKLKKKKKNKKKTKKCRKPNNIIMKIDGVLMVKKRNKWKKV